MFIPIGQNVFHLQALNQTEIQVLILSRSDAFSFSLSTLHKRSTILNVKQRSTAGKPSVIRGECPCLGFPLRAYTLILKSSCSQLSRRLILCNEKNPGRIKYTHTVRVVNPDMTPACTVINLFNSIIQRSPTVNQESFFVTFYNELIMHYTRPYNYTGVDSNSTYLSALLSFLFFEMLYFFSWKLMTFNQHLNNKQCYFDYSRVRFYFVKIEYVVTLKDNAYSIAQQSAASKSVNVVFFLMPWAI